MSTQECAVRLDEWEDNEPSRPRDRHLWMWAVAPAVAALVLVALGICYLFWMSQPRPVTRLSDIERWTDVRFPAGARLMGGTQQWGTEASIQARVMIPRSQVKQFVSQPLFTSVSRNDDVILATGGRAAVTVTVLVGQASLVEVDWVKL
ncbi:MAG: hypothetical protein ACO1SX_18205 [Actinomycetota bacterium]